MHAGHAHPQPPLPPPGTGFIPTHRPFGGHGSVKHAIPSSTQPHKSALSALQLSASVKLAHGSVLGGGGGVTGQSQGAHAVLGGQTGHAQVGDEGAPPLALPPLAVPVPVTPTVPTPQAQSHGGQVTPGAQVGQAQVHVL